MSYRRSYSETITVSGTASRTVSYPASKDGGSMTVSVPYVEYVPVNVNIDVDTAPFDSSVNSCNNRIDTLTGAVVATESAQIVAIQENSKKVAKTIVHGFFDYIRSEISQQINELTQSVDAQVMHLRELAKSCVQKKDQMQSDYNRIASRYQKIFEDLDNEVTVRITELDKPVFQLKGRSADIENRIFQSPDVNTVAIHGAESNGLRAVIMTSVAKNRASNTLSKATQFLGQQLRMKESLKKNSINEGGDQRFYIPISLCEFKLHNQRTQNVVSVPAGLGSVQEKCIQSSIQQDGMSFISHSKLDVRISSAMMKLLSDKYTDSSERLKRIRQEIMRLSEANN